MAYKFLDSTGAKWLMGKIKEVRSTLTAHTENKSNPHNVTAAQVGALPTKGGTVTGDATFSGKLLAPMAQTIFAQTVEGTTPLSSGTDLNDLILPGTYTTKVSSVSNTLRNTPTSEIFRVEVMNVTQDNRYSAPTAWMYLAQYAMTLYGDLWYRYGQTSTGTTMNWGGWNKLYSYADSPYFADIHADSLIDRKNSGTQICLAPQIVWSEISDSPGVSEYFKRWLIRICTMYPKNRFCTFLARMEPDATGFGFCFFYDCGTVNSDGLPQYAFGAYFPIGGNVITFGTNAYEYYIRSI